MQTPDYLTTNQSEEHPWAGHTSCNPPPPYVFKNISLKATSEFPYFEHYLSGLLVWPCKKCYTFFHRNPMWVDWPSHVRVSRPNCINLEWWVMGDRLALEYSSVLFYFLFWVLIMAGAFMVPEWKTRGRNLVRWFQQSLSRHGVGQGLGSRSTCDSGIITETQATAGLRIFSRISHLSEGICSWEMAYLFSVCTEFSLPFIKNSSTREMAFSSQLHFVLMLQTRREHSCRLVACPMGHVPGEPEEMPSETCPVLWRSARWPGLGHRSCWALRREMSPSDPWALPPGLISSNSLSKPELDRS